MTPTASAAASETTPTDPAPTDPGSGPSVDALIGAPTDSSFTERYRAIASRDTRFDGQFFTAVRSTGIYCRPSCPARTPRPENVTFYRTSAAAHAAGYRACKRCLPEAVPGTPEWDVRRDLAGRAMRLVRDGVVDREGVDGLAARLGYTARHVHRVLAAELGAGPLALARAQRAQTARSLIVQTDLPLADVAFAAGFGSIRQFNDTMSEVFALAPSELRARARRRTTPGATMPNSDTDIAHIGIAGDHHPPPSTDAAHPANPAGPATDPPPTTAAAFTTDPAPATSPPGPTDPAGPGPLLLRLPFREPYDARGIIRFLADRAIPGIEWADIDSLTYARTLALPHGPGAFEASAQDGNFTVRLELGSLADLPTAVARVRHLFDLDADPLAVDEALAADPVLRPSVEAAPGIRLPGAVDGDELVARALIGQQISVAAARTHLGRLAAALGTPMPLREPRSVSVRFGLTRLFPTAAQLATGWAGVLTGPARRREAFGVVMAALAAGDVVVSRACDPAELRPALLALPGVGPWTAGYVAMRVLHDPDVLLATDGALLAGARALGIDGAGRSVTARARAVTAHGERWTPWRSYASMHLWRAAP